MIRQPAHSSSALSCSFMRCWPGCSGAWPRRGSRKSAAPPRTRLLLHRLEPFLEPVVVLRDHLGRPAETDMGRFVLHHDDSQDRPPAVAAFFSRFRIVRPFAIFPGAADIENVNGCSARFEFGNFGHIVDRFSLARFK